MTDGNSILTDEVIHKKPTVNSSKSCQSCIKNNKYCQHLKSTN